MKCFPLQLSCLARTWAISCFSTPREEFSSSRSSAASPSHFWMFSRKFPPEEDSACGRALRSRERIIIEDVEADEGYAPYRTVASAAGYRAIQSTLLISRDGTPLGTIALHFRNVHRPSPEDLERLDLYARQAAGFIERCRTEETLRESEEWRAVALRAGQLGIYDYYPQSGRLKWDGETYRLWGVPEGEAVTYETFESGVHPDDLNAFRAALRETFDPAAPRRRLECEYRVVNRADGSIRWIAADGDVTFEGGQPVRLAGTVQDITERKRAQERIQLLMREVNHRSKNMLSIVQAIARQTAASSPGDFLERFGDRIQALSASQDLLIKNAWKGVALDDLVRSQLGLFEDSDRLADRTRRPAFPDFRFRGSNAWHGPARACHQCGQIWRAFQPPRPRRDRMEPGARRRRRETAFYISWCESGGPPVSEPYRRGFGSVIIADMPEGSLGAKVFVDYARSGFTWRLRCPAHEALEGGQRVAPSQCTSLAGKTAEVSAAPRILIVEDEAIVALEIAEILKEGGFCAVGPACSVAQALELLKANGCDAAVLDINLGKETSEAVAMALTQLNTPFVTVSGYSKAQKPAAFADAPALTKPVRPDRLIHEVWRCMDGEQYLSGA